MASPTPATSVMSRTKLKIACAHSPQTFAPGESIPQRGHALAAVLTCAPHSRQGLRAIPDLPVRSPRPECNLKEVALKETIRSICVREEDAQGTAAGHPGQEHAPAA